MAPKNYGLDTCMMKSCLFVFNEFVSSLYSFLLLLSIKYLIVIYFLSQFVILSSIAFKKTLFIQLIKQHIHT